MIASALPAYLNDVTAAFDNADQLMRDIAAFKKSFYSTLGQSFNQCIQDNFGQDAPTTQTVHNAPILNLRYTQAQLSSNNMAGAPAVAWNQPSKGKFGTVYIAKDVLYGGGTNALNFEYGSFAHETANILDERLNPNVPPDDFGRTYGDLTNNEGDNDTGSAVERCMFGHLQYPNK